MMNVIEAKLLDFFQLRSDKNLIIAYSGGVDSQVLLYGLAKLKQQGKIHHNISVCHVNHGLSQNADHWQTFAEKTCQQLSLPLIVKSLTLNKQPQQSLEAIARAARYQSLVNVSVPSAYIVTGHHLDDQNETFFLALKRGSGINGLSAMAQVSSLAQHQLVRPLLTVSKAEILAYAKKQQLDWIDDESNNNQDFDRNFIRHSITPLLNERWSGFDKNLQRSIEHCQNALQLINEVAAEDLQQVICDHNSLHVDKLNQLTRLRFNYLIRYFLSQQGKIMPSVEQLKQVQQQLTAKKDKNPVIHINDYCFRRYQDKLYLTANFADISTWQYQVANRQDDQRISVVLPDQLGEITLSMNSQAAEDSLVQIKIPKPEQAIRLCFYHDNPKCLPDFRDKSRSLKKILQELNIPPWQRKRTPFLYYDNELVAALGLFICKNYLPTKQENKLVIHWCHD